MTLGVTSTTQEGVACNAILCKQVTKPKVRVSPHPAKPTAIANKALNNVGSANTESKKERCLKRQG